MRRKRRVCFVTGTRAEFGLMQSTLRAIRLHPSLQLQLIVTGMHLDRSRGLSIDEIRRGGWKIDRIVKWRQFGTPHESASQTGKAICGIAGAFAELDPQIVLVVGDRVEAFAAASAAQISGVVVAHVHGGDRAAGQVDDSLRHAITKLAHLHLPATRESAKRIARMGEQRWRIRRVGSPGLDDVRAATPTRARANPFVLFVLHPVATSELLEYRRARTVLRAVSSLGVDIVAVYPNNDPGAGGIARSLDAVADGPSVKVLRNVPRPEFLALMRDALAMVGNSSSGIIEAASFGTPVIDVGPRQLGRERSKNVRNVPYDEKLIRAVLAKIWNSGKPLRSTARNVYGGTGAGEKIAGVLSTFPLDDRTRRKLIAY
jgi:UDP-N-acetylglucosamine 2-epimerase (non-hydrolysing)/GDP/UDP-N,N'-diacetylbacillosamine 2-epimerase (hydrolysing)